MMANVRISTRVFAIAFAGVIVCWSSGSAHRDGIFSGRADAQTVEPQKRPEPQRKRKLDRQGKDSVPAVGSPEPVPRSAATPAQPLPPEKVEADVSARSIAVTSGFTGTEILVFGSVDNSRQTSAEAGYYDVVVVVEGASTPLLVRRKSNVAGIWINTDSATFEGAPSYYAVASTRPIEEIADLAVFERSGIGLDAVRLAPAAKSAIALSPLDFKAYKDAVIRLKEKEGLYIRSDYAVAFVGRGLFRSTIGLPPNVPVGPLTARVYLFHGGELLSTYTTRVKLEREGIELWLYRFAFRHSVLYGISAVLLAAVAGLLASLVMSRQRQ